MSHIVEIQTKVHDPIAVASACRRLNLPAPVVGSATLFSGAVNGLIVQLPGWQYPCVVEPLTGTIRYDNFGGQWGDEKQLHRFLQTYAVEKARQEARHKGYQVTESTLQDGSIKLRIVEGQ